MFETPIRYPHEDVRHQVQKKRNNFECHLIHIKLNLSEWREKDGPLRPGSHQDLEAKQRSNKYINYPVALVNHKLFKRQGSVFPISAVPCRTWSNILNSDTWYNLMNE